MAEAVAKASIDALNAVADTIADTFLDKDEIARLLVISALAGENLILIGPPGTAKSAVIRTMTKLLGCNYFEYLLTRFTEPNELFGPVDIVAFREGSYKRRIEGMLPQAEVAFLDEVFKANSAILNSMLTLLNERVYAHGGTKIEVPLLCLFGASNEVPEDEDLGALYDRFLLRVYSDNLESHHFTELLNVGTRIERSKTQGRSATKPLLDAPTLRAAQRALQANMKVSPRFADAYKSIVFQIRNEGLSFSDRRAVKMVKLFNASAALRGASEPEVADLALLRHVWNSPGQRQLLADLVDPVVDAWLVEHPQAKTFRRAEVTIDALGKEIALVEEMLATGGPLTDTQMFSQLKNVNDVRSALIGDDRPAAKELLSRVDALLEGLFASSHLSDI